MLKRKLFQTVMAVATAFLIAPSQLTLAASADSQSLDDFFGYTWDNNDYTAPPDIDGAPGFVPFNDIFSPVTKIATGDSTTVAGSSVLTNSKGSDVGVEVTHTTKQQGSIWNTGGNELDLTKDFHAQMQLYFGDNENSGDGLAFVMAGSRPETLLSGAGGGRLGVWGNLGGDKSNAKNETAYSTALPKSFVVVFDTYPNMDGVGDGGDYDAAVFHTIKPTSPNRIMPSKGGLLNDAKNAAGKYNQYIAYGYPSQPNQYIWETNSSTDASTYGKRALAFAGNGQVYSNSVTNSWNGSNQTGMGAAQLVPRGSFTDGKWHLLTLDYKSDGNGGGTLTYTVDVTSTAGVPVTQTITWSSADIDKYFGTHQVSWGFTGSTGDSIENGVVAFQSIPGLLDNSVTTTLLDEDAATAVTQTYVGRKYQQQYTVNYDGADSKQSWPAGTDAKLAADLHTGDNYGFVVTNGVVQVKVTGADGNEKTVTATPVDTVDTASGTIARNIRLSQLDGFQKSSGSQSATIVAPVIATGVGAEATLNSGTVGGDNGLVSGKVTLPGPQVPPLSLDSVPDFDFGSVGMVEVMGGLKAKTGTLLNGKQFRITLPGDTEETVEAQMSSFDLGGKSGNVQVGFKLDGKQVTLTDNGATIPVFQGKQLTNQDVSDPTITTQPTANAEVRAYESQITWNIVNAATK